MEEKEGFYGIEDVKESTVAVEEPKPKPLIEIKNAKDLIKELFPEFEPAKHWLTYSIYFDQDATTFTVNRKPNAAYKWKTAFILPFIILPYSFWFGYRNVRVQIWASFKGNYVLGRYCDKEKYDKIVEYAREHDLLK